jgi:hypothetical protein
MQKILRRLTVTRLNVMWNQEKDVPLEVYSVTPLILHSTLPRFQQLLLLSPI